MGKSFMIHFLWTVTTSKSIFMNKYKVEYRYTLNEGDKWIPLV